MPQRTLKKMRHGTAVVKGKRANSKTVAATKVTKKEPPAKKPAKAVKTKDKPVEKKVSPAPKSAATDKSKNVKKTVVTPKKDDKKPAPAPKAAAPKVQDKVVLGKKPLEGGKAGTPSSHSSAKAAPPPAPLKVEPKIIEAPQPEFKARPTGEELFTKDELEVFRGLLVSERAKILAKARRAMEEGNIQIDKNEMFDEVDQAAAMIDQNLTFRLLDRDRKLLFEIDHALAKIDTGDYGYCEGTGEPIPKRRLELRPWCRHSVKYKEKLERMKKSGRGVVDEDEM